MSICRVLFLSALAIVFPLLTGCAEVNSCEKVTVVFKDMHSADEEMCDKVGRRWEPPQMIDDMMGTGSALVQKCILIGEMVHCGLYQDPCGLVHREEMLCAEVATALMQSASFRDSVLSIEP